MTDGTEGSVVQKIIRGYENISYVEVSYNFRKYDGIDSTLLFCRYLFLGMTRVGGCGIRG